MKNNPAVDVVPAPHQQAKSGGVVDAEVPSNVSRREFLKKSAATAAALTLGPAVLTKYARGAEETINIGCIASMTGYLSDQAQNVVEGMELGVDEVNRKGGLLGKQLKLLVRDDEMKPPVGTRRYEELVKNQGIVMHSGVVFAPIASSIQQMNKNMGDKGIIEFQGTTSPTMQTPAAADPKGFYVGATLEAYGLVGGEHMTKNVGKKTFIIYADYLWGWDIKQGFLKTSTPAGAEVLGSLAVPPGTTDFQPYLTQLMVKNVDYATLIINGGMFINCIKQAYAMGLKDKMKFVTFHGNIEEVNSCGPEVIKDVFIVTDYFWNIQNPKNKEFVDKYTQKYGASKRPSMRTFAQHTSVLMWADAVKKVGTVDPNKVAPVLLGLKGDYGKGTIEIRKTGDHTAVQPVVVARGKGPGEMKDKFDTQEIVKLYTGDKYFYSAKEKGWS